MIISMSIADYVLLFIIAVCIIAAVIFSIRQTKKGKCIGCSSNCGCCNKKSKA